MTHHDPQICITIRTQSSHVSATPMATKTSNAPMTGKNRTNTGFLIQKCLGGKFCLIFGIFYGGEKKRLPRTGSDGEESQPRQG